MVQKNKGMGGYVCEECGGKHELSQLDANRHICPACGYQTFIISVFGSICSKCFFDPAKDVPATPTKQNNKEGED